MYQDNTFYVHVCCLYPKETILQIVQMKKNVLLYNYNENEIGIVLIKHITRHVNTV